jgi:hypothetical protein
MKKKRQELLDRITKEAKSAGVTVDLEDFKNATYAELELLSVHLQSSKPVKK